MEHDQDLLESLASAIKQVSHDLTVIAFDGLEVIINDLKDPERQMSPLAQTIRNHCLKVHTLGFNGVYSLHLLWDMLTKPGCFYQLESLHITNCHLLNHSYVLSLFQALNRSERKLTKLKLESSKGTNQPLSDHFSEFIHYKVFRQLEQLSLSNNRFRDQHGHLAAYLNCSHIQWLDLSENHIRGPCLKNLLHKLPASLGTLKLRRMKGFEFSDILSVSDWLSNSRQQLVTLDLSSNPSANSKGILCLLNQSIVLRTPHILKFNDSVICKEVTQMIDYLIEQQRRGAASGLQKLFIKNSRIGDSFGEETVAAGIEAIQKQLQQS